MGSPFTYEKGPTTVHRLPRLLIATMALLLPVSGSATAGNASLRTTLDTWSTKIAGDAHSLDVAARQRHPHLMISSANRFHADAMNARAAVARQRSSTAHGARARTLAVTAFVDYALASANWAASANARLDHHRAASIGDAHAGANYAHTADKLLVAAGKLLR
jgi:hypothetical protein